MVRIPNNQKHHDAIYLERRMFDNVFLEKSNARINNAGHAQVDSRAQSDLHRSWLQLDAPAVQCSNYCVKTRLHIRHA